MPGEEKPRPRITCINCRRTDQPHGGYGWCHACYSRWYRAGRPDAGPPAPGTPPPLDDVAVERAVKGEQPTLTPRERRAAVAELRARGLSVRTIAKTLGCAQRTVERHTAAIKKEGG